MTTNPNETSQQRFTVESFLEETPPLVAVTLTNLDLSRFSEYCLIALPDIRLHCEGEGCSGVRNFAGGEAKVPNNDWHTFFHYYCRNCRAMLRVFAVQIHVDTGSTKEGFTALKLGEFPAYGPPVPSRTLSLVGDDREYFLRGRRAENSGLGLGAFSYYRRVIENQRGRMLGEIIRAAKRIGVPTSVIEQLQRAQSETSFKRSMEIAGAVLPQRLLLGNHNPLTLLHSALSDGLHAQSDAECLSFARSIRVVLFELSDRLTSVLKDQNELEQALSIIMNRKQGAADLNPPGSSEV